MPGRGDNFADVVRQELASLFAPVAEMPPRALSLDLFAQVTYCVISPACSANNVSLATDEPGAHEGLGAFGDSEFTRLYPLLPPEAALANVHCEWDVISCRAPMFVAENISTLGVSFEAMSKRAALPVVIQSWTATGHNIPIPRYVTVSHELRPQRFAIRQKSRIVSGLRARSFDMPASMWAQPLQKTAIPNHRFSTAMKDHFRKTLAKKADTSPANIQIKLVFDRMNMALFENIEQDKQGRLLCYPKSRYIGKNWSRYAKETERKPMYLVFGTVMTTGQNVNALVAGLDEGEVL